ncbi:MAG: hypothetical protein ACLUF9_01130 [Oscillospiraceae bacterium]
MSKAVMLSIRPKWCEKICGGEKTIEVRKTRPKLETPFRCYIYCTLQGCNEFFRVDLVGDVAKWRRGKWADRKGNVIGEFTCDRIDRLVRVGFDGSGEPAKYYICNSDMSVLPLVGICEDACLTKEELEKYVGGHEGFGWYISDLRIYDAPRELSEFERPYECNECDAKWASECNACHEEGKIKRAPQSWCYVEEDT